MLGNSRIGLAITGILSALALVVIGAGLFVESGIYNIGADDHHTKIVLALIEQLREHSIGMRARAIDLRYVEVPQRIKAGAQHYAALCVGCHLAPGVTKSEIRPGLYPHPPNLAQEDLHDGRRAFWIVKHGIKMSAMPAWGKTWMMPRSGCCFLRSEDAEYDSGDLSRAFKGPVGIFEIVTRSHVVQLLRLGTFSLVSLKIRFRHHQVEDHRYIEETPATPTQTTTGNSAKTLAVNATNSLRPRPPNFSC